MTTGRWSSVDPVRSGNVSLNTMLTEISKLEAVRAIGLPVGVFADIAPKVVAAWRGRAAVGRRATCVTTAGGDAAAAGGAVVLPGTGDHRHAGVIC
jgi:hypothetical protein